MDHGTHDGRSPIERSGLSYLPRFIDADEAEALVAYFGQLVPLWEQRYRDPARLRAGRGGYLTRPVYWLGAWQFACLGYYAEPHHRRDRCVRAEPFPPVMTAILDRLLPTLRAHSPAFDAPPNTCLINYYGREVGDGPPRDYARLKMHRDGEPGPVAMFSIGQPGLLEFLDPERDEPTELAVWTRHRSVTVLSGPDHKDRLYHRVRRVRHGSKPALHVRLDDFEVRRISVSFRHVPEELVTDFAELPADSRGLVRDYIEELAEQSAHWRDQLERE